MDSTKLNDWLQVIGIFALVLSLIFVGLQIRQEQEIAIVDTYGSVAEAEIDLAVLVSENFNIWQKGLDDDDLTEEESGRFEGLAAAVEAQYQRNFIRWFRIGPGDPDAIASDFAYALYIFPGLRKVFFDRLYFDDMRDDARGYESDLSPWTQKILSFLETYDEEKPPIPNTKEYFFWTL